MKRGFTAIACVALLQACAQTLSVRPADATDAVNLEGDWNAVMRSTAARQTYADLQFDCDEFSELFFLRVRNGVVSGYLEADENFSFRTRLDSYGVFKAVIPIDSYYRYKKNSSVETSSIVLLLSGNLTPGVLRGRFVIGDRRMNLSGCTTEVEYVAL